jgi:hypothetical protein
MMPRHRRSERLPKRLLNKVRLSPYFESLGWVYDIPGGGLTGPRFGPFTRPVLPNGRKPRIGAPLDVQYSLKDNILTRAEFARHGPVSVPLQIANFDPDSGKRLGTVLDAFE